MADKKDPADQRTVAHMVLAADATGVVLDAIAQHAGFKLTRTQAHKENRCVKCAESIEGRIYSADGRKEWQNSALCELCFDDLFEDTEEAT
jgi:hypothetical protein